MRKKVMIVDDDSVFLEELNEVLISGGYDVVAVNDPVSVFSMVNMTKPDVILIDMKMPSMSGLEVANELKQFLGYDNLPIIAMSGFYRDNDLSLMNMCGIQKCLKKPFRPLDVIYNIEKVLE